MIWQNVGALWLLFVAYVSSIWWVVSLRRTLKLTTSVPMTNSQVLEHKSLFRLPILRIRLPSLKINLWERVVTWVTRQIEFYLKNTQVSHYTLIFVGLIQPYIVVNSLTNGVGVAWMNYFMLGIVMVNWTLLGLRLLRRVQCSQPQGSVSPKPERCRLIELVLYAVPVVYTWYQFFSALG